MVVTENSNSGQMEREKNGTSKENDERENERAEGLKEKSRRAVSWLIQIP